MPPRIGDPGFYGILTDPVVGYDRLAAVMVECGVRVIQLRMKEVASAQVLEQARALRRIIPDGVLFIVNDDPGIAREAGADGVHLGQDDMSLEVAREIVGPDAVIGLSTHNPEQTRAACALGPSYIGVGPVFATPTKKKSDPVIGLDGMRRMLAAATVPAIVLGGIDHDNVGRVLDAGARNVCAVRCVNRSTDPAADLGRMQRAIEARHAR
jgi:thiamine-phosphate pyrophosphorylase